MDLESKLKNEGWYLTEAGIEKLQNSCTNVEHRQNVQKLIEIAKNLDFRDIAGGALPVKRDGDFIPGNIVLQLQRLRVVSAPKANEDSRAAPRFLQLELSDGQSTIMALEMEHISVLNTDIPPGAKLLLRPKQLKLIQGTIELFNTDVKVLGGDVESLAEKWRMARSMQKYARSGRPMTGASGPPPWIAFGKKLELNKDELPNERNFKSLQAASERDKESKENDEFNAMRSEAIAMASKASSRKTFGGGGQVILDHNLKKILEKGYSEEEAKDALRSTNNNLERALYNLKRRHGGAAAKSGSFESNSRGTGPTSGRVNSGNPREGGGGRRNAKEDTLDVKPATTNVSLFDFLSDKFAKPSEAGTSSTSAFTNPTNYTSGRNHSAQQNNDRDAGINNQPSAKSKTNQRDNKDKSSNCTNIKANTNSKNDININRNQTAKDERPKFENNISSSFNANRHHHASGRREPRSGGAQGSERSSGHETSHHREANYARNARGGNNTDQRNTSNLSKPQYPEDQRIMSREFRSERGQRGSRGYVEANNRRETTRYNADRDNTEKVGGGSEVRSKTFGGREQNEQQPTKRGGENEHRHGGGGRNQQQKQAFTNNNQQDMNKLIESTGNLRIDNKVQQPSHSATSAPKQHLAATPHASAQHGKSQPQQYIPNGLPYGSGKKQIKQEYPMNVANSQNLNLNTMPSGQSVTTVAAKGSRTAQNVPVSGAPNQNYLHPSQTSQQQAPKVMQPSWQWKVGDRCLAKYWDDGGFYEAEITGVADTTCVVLYLGYGNHEEVLKTDCLPIQDFIQRPQQHQPLSSHQHHQSSQNHPQQQMIFQSLPHGPENGGVPDGNMRYNNNNNNNKKVNYQLLYVPPPKRKN